MLADERVGRAGGPASDMAEGATDEAGSEGRGAEAAEGFVCLALSQGFSGIFLCV